MSAKDKDRILRALIEKECGKHDEEIATHLGLPQYTVYTLLKEMESVEHIETVETTSVNTVGASCIVRRIYPKGYHHYSTTTYRKEAFNKWLEDVPKKYWFFTAIFAIIAFALPIYLQYCNVPIKPQTEKTSGIKKVHLPKALSNMSKSK